MRSGSADSRSDTVVVIVSTQKTSTQIINGAIAVAFGPDPFVATMTEPMHSTKKVTRVIDSEKSPSRDRNDENIASIAGAIIVPRTNFHAPEGTPRPPVSFLVCITNSSIPFLIVLKVASTTESTRCSQGSRCKVRPSALGRSYRAR
jgi:hypothetical protein